MSTFSQINTNIQSMQAFQSLQNTSSELSMRRQRLSTGKRINAAEDDSAGFAIAKKLQAKTRGQSQALKNISDAKSMLTVAEGGLNSSLDILQTMKEKAVQAANDSLGTNEREAIKTQLDELTSEIQDIAENTEFNGRKLLGKTGGQDLTFQTGSTSDTTFDVSLQEATATNGLGIGNDTSDVTDSNNYSVEDGDFAGLSGDIGTPAIEVDPAGGGFQALTGAGSTSAVNADNEFANLDGGKYNIELTYDSSIASGNGGFQVEVNGSGSETLELDGSGGVTNQTTVTLEEDAGSGDALRVDFDGLDFSDAVDTLADGESGEFTVEVGGDGVEFTGQVDTSANARDTIDTIDQAITDVTDQLAGIGDAQKRLSFKGENLETARTNFESARSGIEDADFAREQMQIAKLQILQQTGTATLAQANASSQSVLSLVGGG
jgi:flagellin